MTILFANNATGALAANANAAATVMTLGAGQGALFPTVVAPNYFKVTVQQSATMEIVKCTARTGDTLTVLRAQEGTTAQNFTTGAAVSHLITAGTFDDLRAEIIASALASATTLAQLWGPPVGTPLPWAGATAPAGYLLCTGQVVSRATYPLLFAALGETWGAGNGTTTFGLPDFRGRVLAGADNMGGVAAARLTGGVLAAVLGTESVALTVPELPAHTHAHAIFAAGSHNHYNPAAPVGQQGGWTSTAPAHSHGVGTSYGVPGGTATAGAHLHQVLSGGSAVQGGGGATASWNNVTMGATSPQGGTFVTDTAPDHTHAVSIDAAGSHMHEIGIWTAPDHTHALTNAAVGGNTAHTNLQPTAVVNWILRGA